MKEAFKEFFDEINANVEWEWDASNPSIVLVDCVFSLDDLIDKLRKAEKNITATAIERAIECALFAHKGQTDKGGQPYILHPLRVMGAMQTDQERIVAVLHDVVEDSPASVDDVRQEFGDTIADAVDALTKRAGESYTEAINRVAMNPLATKVKLADLADNMDLSRLGRVPTTKDMERMVKYQAAKEQLEQAYVLIERGVDGVEVAGG